MSASLTPKQKRVLDFISEFTDREGYRPSQSEIAKGLGFKSLGTIQNYLVRLERGGFLTRTPNARRGVEIPAPQHSLSVPLPLLGKVAAGRPIESEQTGEHIDVPSLFLKPGQDHYVLKVSGQSMIEDGILDGDYVIIRSQKDAQNGETVVALINHAATIKKYFKTAQGIELHPANPSYQPLVLSRSDLRDGKVDFEISGLLAGLIRLP